MADARVEKLAGRTSWLRLRADGDEIRHLLATRAGRLLVVVVAIIAALTALGLLALWPYGWSPPGSGAVSRTAPAKVKRVLDAPCTPGARERCRQITVTVDGRQASLALGLAKVAPSVKPGDAVRVLRPSGSTARPEEGYNPRYEFSEVDRRGALLWIVVVVACLAAALLRWRGILAVIGVGLSLAVLLLFLVPAILAGKPALLTALVAALTVMFVTLVLTNGLGTQTLAAALGISATLVLTCLLGFVAVRFAHLDGTTQLDMLSIRAEGSPLSLQAIVLAAMLVGALGVLADTAVTQASAVMALRRANPTYEPPALYRAAFTIGRDHLSATIHTLVLAYAGAMLPLLLVTQTGRVDSLDALNGQSIAEPIVAAAVGITALIVAVPLTTALASLFVARLPLAAVPDAHHH
jgi:uncharacterized membrane protein